MKYQKSTIVRFLLVSILACDFVCMAKPIDNELQEGANFINVLKQALSKAQTLDDKKEILDFYLIGYYVICDEMASEKSSTYPDSSIISITYSPIMSEFFACAKILKQTNNQTDKNKIQSIVTNVWQHNLSRLNAYPVCPQPLFEEQFNIALICRNLFCIDAAEAQKVIQERCQMLPEKFQLPLRIFQEQAGWIQEKDNVKNSGSIKKNANRVRLSILVRTYLNSPIGIEFQLAKLYLTSRSLKSPDDTSMSVKEFANKYAILLK